MMLIGYSELLAAVGATGSQYTTAILSGHSLTEAMLVHTAAVVRLKCSFHLLIRILICYYSIEKKAIKPI